MKPLSPRVVAAATFAVLAAVGAAFVKQGADRDEAERRVEAARVVDRAAASLEHEIDAVFAQLVAARSGGDAPAGRLRIESVLLASHGRLVAAAPARAPSLDAEDLPQLEGVNAALIGPLRGADGARKIAARIPARASDLTRDSLVAVLDLAELPGAALLPQLSGYDYRLAAVGGRAAPLARSGEMALRNPVTRELSAGPERWSLAIAPREGWIRWPPVLLNAILVMVLSLAGALTAHDLSRQRGVLERALEDLRTRLRAANRRLVEEVQQREAFEKQFSHASFHDSLTGLANRRLLESRLEQGLMRARTGAEGAPAFAVLELDRIKAVADSLGPGLADEVLAQAARRFEARAGDDAAVGRVGDAEFGLVLSGGTRREDALAIVDRLHRALEEPFEVAGQRLFVAAHAGIAFSHSGYDHPDDLVRGARIALGTAQRARLPHVVFDPSTREQVLSRHQLETDLHRVDERGELRIAFQPVVSLATEEITGFEALVRWQHPVEGMLGPGRFVALAEESGLITPITRWMVRAACQQVAAWRAERPDASFYVSVNLSAHDLRDARMCDYVQGVLEETHLPPGALRLEVTESAMIDNVRAAGDVLARFREMGTAILLDDFGTGYSSLSYLHRFQIDYLKVDQSFVSRMTPDPRSCGVVRAILHLAEGMGISTIAEGIETPEAASLLRAMRCDFGQGYHYSRPVDALAAGALLARGRLGAAEQR